MYEYPKAEDITDAQKSYIAGYLDDFETALLQDDFGAGERSYANYIDIGSFVDYFLINELGRNVDAYRISTFLVKDRDGKLAMGPVWDFNIGFDEGGRIPMDDWVINYNNYVNQDAWMMPFWWKRLMEDPQFRSELKSRWTELRANTLSTSKVLELTTNTANYLTVNNAIIRNYTKWTGINYNYNNSVTDLKTYLTNRLAWMDSKISAF